jgi:hypothetical protein
MVKPGNALLDALAEFGQLDLPSDESEYINFDDRAMKIPKLPTFTDDSFSPLEHERRADQDRDTGEMFNDAPNIHWLAWYLPRRRGPQWGIYFDLSRMMDYVDRIHRDIQRIRPVPKHEVANEVWAQVLRHEIEHCVQELVIAKAATGPNPPYDLQNSIRNAATPMKEALATFQELTDFVSPISNRSNSRLITYIASKLGRPAFYELWDKVDIDYEERMYAHHFGFHPSNDNPCADFRNLIDGRAVSPYISIPIYVIATNFKKFGYWAAVCGVTEKRFAKKILNSRFAQRIDPALSVSIGTGFDIIVSMPGHSDTLVLNTQSNELLSGEKFSKLADICRIDPEMLAYITRYWFV